MLVVVFHISGSSLPNGGAVGVTTFFVLSGFLITRLLVREHAEYGRIDLKAFYVRRVLRLYPALLVFLLVLPLLMLTVHDPNLSTYFPQALFAGLYLSDFGAISGFGMGILTHTWSLAVEEQFYLVWPILLIVVLALAGKRKRIFGLVVLFFVAALAWRIWGQVSLDHVRVYYGPDTNFFAMLGGASLGALRYLPRLPKWLGWLALTLLLALAVSRPVLGLEPGAFSGWVVTAAGIVTVIVVWSASQGSLSVLETGAAKWLGGISYGIYLWHDALLKLQVVGDEAQGVDRILMAAVAIFVAWISFRLVERPTLELKKRFERSTIG